METIPCPGCRTLLGPEITVCPICTRPRSKYEIARAYAALRAAQERRRKRPYQIALYSTVLALAAWAAHEYRTPLMAAVAAGRSRVVRFVDEARDPGRLMTPGAETPTQPHFAPSGAPTAAGPAPIDTPEKSSWTPPEAAQTRTAPPPPAPRPAPPLEATRGRPTGDLPLPAVNDADWVLRGTAYDLLTLRPAANMTFNARSSEARSNIPGTIFMTDGDGRYLVTLKRVTTGGYEILADSPNYAPATYYESDIPYAELSKDERQGMADNALSGDANPTPVTDIIGEDAIHRDLFVVPRR
ncbi:MAG: hypothetical protein KGJ84_04990 [Elusimicrobia bacterium]|nr:hypothetical protein [Elusimicrobiota bacterium]